MCVAILGAVAGEHKVTSGYHIGQPAVPRNRTLRVDSGQIDRAVALIGDSLLGLGADGQ